jgi:hypothetical protein
MGRLEPQDPHARRLARPFSGDRSIAIEVVSL